MFTETSWLSVGQAGVVRLDIPVYTIGNGKPVFGITCSVHGDEPSGLYIVARLLEYLKQVDKISGTIHIVPAANPAAQLVNKRVSPLDLKDLNRAGRGRQDGTFTDRVGARLFDFLSQCDLVVNIHEFEMHTPVTAVFMNAGDTSTKIKTLAAIRAFAPDILWVINPDQNSDTQYQATLDTALAQAGIANFPIETTQLAFLSEDEIDKAALGLFHVATHLGICKSFLELHSFVAPAFFRQEVTAGEAGLWEPNCELMQAVEAGEQIGMLRTLTGFQQMQINSPSKGILVQYRHRHLVATGTSLFSLGHDASYVIASYLGK
jgi:predicted deacylase